MSIERRVKNFFCTLKVGFWIVVLGGGTLGCTDSIEDICQKSIPQLTDQVRQVLNSTDLWSSGVQRGIASDLSPPVLMEPSPMTDQDQARLLRWTEESLVRSQNLMSQVEGEALGPLLKKVLSELSIELVILHGYTQSRQPERIRKSLEKVLAQILLAENQVCVRSTSSAMTTLNF